MSAAGRAAVIGLVRAITPASEPGNYFRCDADANGGETPLDAQLHIMRAFDLVTEGVAQGDIASATPVQWEERWTLRVNYPLHRIQDRERLVRIATADFRSIVAAVQPTTAGWSTYLSNLSIGHEPATLQEVAGDGGEPVALWLFLPVDVEFFE